MQLRNHPGMISNDHPLWPPKWHPSLIPSKAPTSEAGTLVKVLPFDISPPFCFWIVAEFEGAEFTTLLSFEDENFYKCIIEVFNQHIGRPLSDLGSAEIGL